MRRNSWRENEEGKREWNKRISGLGTVNGLTSYGILRMELTGKGKKRKNRRSVFN